MAHARIVCWIPKDTNTHPDHVIVIASPLASFAAGTRLGVTLYKHCLSRFRMAK